MSTMTTWQPPSWLKTARPRSGLSQLWQVPIFLLGLAALVSVCCGAVWRQGQQRQDFRQRLEMVRETLKRKDADLTQLVPVAESLVEQSSYFPSQAGEAHFLLSSVLLRLVDGGAPEEARTLRQRALEHLQQAETNGVPLHDQPALWFLLGKTLAQTNGDCRQAIDFLARALPKGTDNPADGYRLLAELYLKLPVPEVDAALLANDQQLKNSNDEAVLLPARLLRAELFVRKKCYDDALKVLERVSPTAPEALRPKAVYLQAISCEAKSLWSKAAPLWEELLRAPQVVPGGKQHIYYTLGKCYHNANPPVEPKAIKAWEQAQQGSGVEAQAAGIYLAEIYVFGLQPDLDLAAAYLQQALVSVKSQHEYANPFVALEEVRELVESAITFAHSGAALEQARKFTQIYQKLSPPGIADRKLAEISVTWAKDLEAKAAQSASEHPELLQQQARTHWAQAAEAYQQAAKAKSDGKPADFLWQSIQCWRKAAENENVIDLVKEYLKLPLAVDDQARAWFMLGETYQLLSKKGEAENAFYKCWEFSDSPFSYRARYQLAQMKIGEKKLDKAEEILWVNVKSPGPNLDREAQEKSLYLLAGLLYQRGNYAQSYLWLQEAARRYPDNPEVFAVRDLLGDSYFQLARQAEKKLEMQGKQLPATALAQLKKSRLDWLDKSGQEYQRLADDLKALKDRQPLTAQQEKLFRKATLTRADVEFETDSHVEALRRYQQFGQLYQGQIEELIACHRIWRCCQALKQQPKEFELSLKALAATLNSVQASFAKLPEEYFQGGPGTWSRKDWQNFLNLIGGNAPQPPAVVSPPPAVAPPAPPTP